MKTPRASKTTRSMHIKRRTKGTSNELSFSVLDERSEKFPADNPTPPVAPSAEDVALMLYSSRAMDQSQTNGRARRAWKAVFRIALAAAAVALVVWGGAELYRSYAGNVEGMAELESAIAHLSQTDDVLSDLDEVVVDPFAESAAVLRASVEEELQDALSLLDEADALAKEAAGELTNLEDQEAASQVLASVSARRELFELGEELLAVADAAQTAADYLQAAWDSLIGAAELASEAAQLVAESTTENIEMSLANNQEALAELAQAREALEAAEASFELDLSAYYAYIDKREEALNCAIASDTALLDGDTDEAAAQNEAYNEADAEAALLAADLPEDPASYVEAAYEELVSEVERAYNDARSQAAAADAAISEYVEG